MSASRVQVSDDLHSRPGGSIGATFEPAQHVDVPAPARLVLDKREQIGLQGLTSRPGTLGKRIPDLVGNVSNLERDHACILHA